MTYALKQHQVDINGKTFIFRLLNVTQGRKALVRLQAFLPMWSSDDVAKGMGPLLAVGLSGGIREDDLDVLCEIFGASSQVVLSDGRQLPLSSTENQNETFAGAYDDMLAWLDECVKFNFGGVVEKIKGVLRNRAEATPAKKP